MADMIAKKSMRYGTRRLLPDDDFTANNRDARVLNAIGKARYATRVAVADDDTPIRRAATAPARPAADERPALRAAYETRFGKKAFPGWSAALLREKLAAN